MTREEIKKIVESLLEKLGFSGQVTVSEREFLLKVTIDIQSEQSLLIGHDGLNLAAFQHLVRLIAKRSLKEDEISKDLYIDVNHYWEEKEKRLSLDAVERAKEVISTGGEYIFPPMDAHNRKVIHGAVMSMNNIQSESIGSGRDRRVRLYKVDFS